MRFAALCATVLFLLPSCGSGTQNRPEIVSTFPADRQVLQALLGAIRITYDEEVVILNDADAEVVDENEGRIPVTMTQRAGEPCCVYVRPIDGAFFPPDEFLVVKIERGAVINAEDHYAEEEFIYGFTMGPAPALHVGRGGVVTPLDAETLAPGADVPTPGGRIAVGILETAPNNTPRVYVQLADGGGAREALAYFAPGAAAMTPVALSTSTGAGDVTTTARTLTPGPDGENLYLAFRDETDGTVRIHRVDVATGMETAALVLSVPAGPTTEPLGMSLDAALRQLFVACADGATGRQAYVDIDTFTEIDRDLVAPGTQAVVLPAGAGPIVAIGDQAMIAPPGGSEVTFTRTSGPGIAQFAITGAGMSVDALRTTDFRLLLQPLRAYVDGMGLVTRTSDNDYLDAAFVTISDDVGAGPTGATKVSAMGGYATDHRFLMVLDTDVLTRWRWDGVGFVQEDLDPNVDGIQGLDASATVPGITTVGRIQGAFPDTP